ncbi:hypothetical protein EDC96DRAFT_25685 [Choanephora cucurbitarum]|nr:hypothetical protein EDC96DRAFT_25685 [Choanephora cucurbitarum]
MTIIGSLPFFSLFSTQSKPDRIRKSIVPFSAAIKRQQFSSSSNRALPKSSTYYQYKQDVSANSSTQARANEREVVTESSIMNNFPRPNLMPTLHLTLFGYQSPTEDNQNRPAASSCSNCSGPHSTDFCPC